MIVVADSSPLISLAILNKLYILDKTFDEIYVPTAVYDEITRKNKPHSQELEKFAINRVKQIQNRLAVQLLQKELDKLVANHRRISQELYDRALELAGEK